MTETSSFSCEARKRKLMSGREFSTEVKRIERVAAGKACRICGIAKELSDGLQFAHIYTQSQNSDWKREGSIEDKWKDDSYVSSEPNCLLLCVAHHRKVDSAEGRQICTVEYLESLKSELLQCTALIKDRTGKVRRCKNSNGRGSTQGDPYRCHVHSKGGLENPVKEDTPAPVKSTEVPEAAPVVANAEKGRCTLL